MKKLGVRVGSGIGITHDWTDQELVDILHLIRVAPLSMNRLLKR